MLKKIKELFRKKEFQFLPIEQVGNWRLEMNRPFGFIISNLQEPKTEYHFYFQSNGWITGVSYRNKKEKEMKALNWNGLIANHPVLVDRQSCESYYRAQELRDKGNNLSESEAKELLALLGQIKSEK